MRLRQLLLATGAIVAAGALALAPTAQATNPTGGPIARIVVGGNAGNFGHATTFTMKSAQLQMTVFGVPMSLNCTAGAGNGMVNGGVTGLTPLAGEVVNALSLTCAGLLPGTTLTLTTVCPLEIVYADPNVHVGLLDVGVPGTTKLSAVDGVIHMTSRANPLVHCLQGSTTSGCQFLIGGSTPVQFDETVKVVGGQNRQDLHLLGGPGLLVKNPSGTCPPANTPLTLSGVFNNHLANGTVDFQD